MTVDVFIWDDIRIRYQIYEIEVEYKIRKPYSPMWKYPLIGLRLPVPITGKPCNTPRFGSVLEIWYLRIIW